MLSAAVIVGLFLDGWNHLNLQQGRLGDFFTPWHGVLYAAFTANAVWVFSRNAHLWRTGVEPHPAFHPVGAFRLRYPYAVLGVGLVFAGMVSDLVWHAFLGEETDVARVIAPTHVVLFLGATLLIAAPLRSAWYAPDAYPTDGSLRRLLPPLLSLALLTTAACFFFQWISPFMEWSPSPGAAENQIVAATGEGVQTTMAARIVLTNIFFVVPVLLAMRRWRLPFGTATLNFVLAALAMSTLTSFGLVATVLAAVIGGVATDAAMRAARTLHLATRMAVVAVVAPLTTWSAYFLLLRAAYGGRWPADFALGVTFLGALVGLVLAFLASLAEPPDVAQSDTR